MVATAEVSIPDGAPAAMARSTNRATAAPSSSGAERDPPFDRQSEGDAAGGEHAETWCAVDEPTEIVGGVDDVLEVVEHDTGSRSPAVATIASSGASVVPIPHAAAIAGGTRPRLVDGGEIDDGDRVGQLRHRPQLAGDLDGDAGLAHAGRSHQGDEAIGGTDHAMSVSSSTAASRPINRPPLATGVLVRRLLYLAQGSRLSVPPERRTVPSRPASYHGTRSVSVSGRAEPRGALAPFEEAASSFRRIAEPMLTETERAARQVVVL